MNMYNLACSIAKQAHNGQVDKGCHPYFEHPLCVSELVSSNDEKIVALLHDVVEDTPVTLLDLEKHLFSNDIIFAVDCITRRNGEKYDDYLKRVCQSKLAITVKIADMTHNSDISRIINHTQKDLNRVEKYKEKITWLKEVSEHTNKE